MCRVSDVHVWSVKNVLTYGQRVSLCHRPRVHNGWCGEQIRSDASYPTYGGSNCPGCHASFFTRKIFLPPVSFHLIFSRLADSSPSERGCRLDQGSGGSGMGGCEGFCSIGLAVVLQQQNVDIGFRKSFFWRRWKWNRRWWTCAVVYQAICKRNEFVEKERIHKVRASHVRLSCRLRYSQFACCGVILRSCCVVAVTMSGVATSWHLHSSYTVVSASPNRAQSRLMVCQRVSK